MIRRASLRASCLWLSLVVLATACSTRSGDTGAAEPRPADVEIVVENNLWQDVTIYALRRGSRVRLGTVISMNTGRFTLPVGVAGAHELILIADPVGSRETFRSEPVMVDAGDIIEWDLVNNVLR